MRFTLGKQQKLKSRKSIEALFTNGERIRTGPLQLIYQLCEDSMPHKMGCIVSKRFFKKAPDRNRVKRLLREAYRLQQHNVSVLPKQHLEFMIIFQSPKMPEQQQVNQWMQQLIEKLNKNLDTTQDQ